MSWKPTTEPVVITCALTGGIHGKEANPNLPEQPDEIVEQGIDAWRAGAAVLHVHARNPDGSNTMDPAIYGELHERLCAETDAVVQLTTGGSPRLSVEERITTVRLAPEMCSLNMGLLNFFIRGEQVFFPNHRSDIERFAQRDPRARRAARSSRSTASRCSRRSSTCSGSRSSSRRTRSTSCCTRRRRAASAARRATSSTRSSASRDLPVDPEDLRVTVTLDGRRRSCRSRRSGWPWGSTCASGWRTTCSCAAASRCVDNAQLVERTVRIANELDRRPATPDEARERFGLRGREAGSLPAQPAPAR